MLLLTFVQPLFSTDSGEASLAHSKGGEYRMKPDWNADELAEHWSLLPSEKQLLGNKTGATRLGFAVLLKFFQQEGCFPRQRPDVPGLAIAYVAHQVGVAPEEWAQYDWDGRTIKYHRAQIRTFLGFREATVDDGEAVATWLAENLLPQDHRPGHLHEAVRERCRGLHIEPPTPERIDRLVRSALHAFEKRFCAATLQRLSPLTCERLEALLLPEPLAADETPTNPEPGRAVLTALLADPGPASLESLLEEIAKLDRVRALQLPAGLFDGISPKVLQTYRQRLAVEAAYELRRHATPLRLTLLAIFGHLRERELTDTLVDLLLATVHRIGARAERRVEKELLEDLKRVAGKNGLLFQLAEVTLARPDGLVKDVVYPVVNEQTLRDLVKEWQASGPAYRKHVQTVIRNSYRSHYRRLLPRLLETLNFRSNNEAHQPVLHALAVVKKYADSKLTTYPADEDVPVEGVVRGPWQDAVLEPDKDGTPRVNRISYEICVLQALREQLRCKEVWVSGANRYRNPDEDVPADFDAQRPAYYAALQLSQDADAFVARVRQDLTEALTAFDRTLPQNPYVQILSKAGGWIALSPLDPQPEPENLLTLKADLAARWPMTGLLDMLKETDLRVGFSDAFRSATAFESMDRATLQQRLLLCLYGLGTNTGLKRMSAGEHGATYKDLLYIRRRFITRDQLRHAITQVVNAIFRVRLPQVWGEGTTACASDSKKFGAWDQNLMTEWHARYGGRGVMIYWHVKRKATCIYSQLKTCSSSEVAAMIEGVLRHCTEMAVDRQYVDSHGQSEVAFAFCRLLGFQLLPRLKAIHKQKLYRPEAGKPEAFPRLQPVLSRPINWNLIGQQYDAMVKYATALRLGTAETEAILRRFTRNNVQHPTYKALAELGKALKTTFLCRYLQGEALRREIQEGLNVIENWNSANGFIFFGKGGELASNRHEDQEVSMLALHLLQISLVYVNTLMIQRILADPSWSTKRILTTEDLRALTPLIYGHVNPYEIFRLDMNARLPIDTADAPAA
jgi:TnpA family transposase